MALARQLGQTTPANTNAVSIYTPGDRKTARVTLIVVTNTTGGALSFRLFHDEDGTTYDTTTALYYDKNVPANDSVVLQFNTDQAIFMNNSSGNLAIRSSSANNLTFTVYGFEAVEGTSRGDFN
jgi:hypothetical protein